MASPGISDGEESACSVGDPGSTPGLGDALNKAMAPHSSILTWKIPWTEEPGGLQRCFSRVRLCATPQMAAHQAPPSLGFSRQKHWSGVPFHENKMYLQHPLLSWSLVYPDGAFFCTSTK